MFAERNCSHVAIVFRPQGGLYVVEDMVFTNAMATFSQCGSEEVSLGSPGVDVGLTPFALFNCGRAEAMLG